MNYIFINSEDRLFNSPVEQATYNLFQTMNKTKCELLGFSCPNTIFNINAFNCNITFTDNSLVQHTVVITNGAYTEAQLMTAIAAAMLAVCPSQTWAASINVNTFQTIITSNSTFQLNFGTGINQMYKLLGFLQVDTGFLLVQTSTYCFNLGFPTSLLLFIDGLTVCYDSPSSNKLPTFVIPIADANSAEIINYYSQNFFTQTSDVANRSLQKITIIIRDQDANPINLNGSNYTLILGVS